MTKQEYLYWLTEAVKFFGEKVWKPGISKEGVAMEFEAQTIKYAYQNYSITIDRFDEDVVEVCVSSGDKSSIIVLNYFIEYPDMIPQLTLMDYRVATDLLENVSDLWTQGLFEIQR